MVPNFAELAGYLSGKAKACRDLSSTLYDVRTIMDCILGESPDAGELSTEVSEVASTLNDLAVDLACMAAKLERMDEESYRIRTIRRKALLEQMHDREGGSE